MEDEETAAVCPVPLQRCFCQQFEPSLKAEHLKSEVPPEVTDLQVGDVEVDTFVLTWERPKDCFDYYTIEVIDENTNVSSGVTCNDGAMIKPNQTSVTCNQTKTCANVTIRVLTHTTGPPNTLFNRCRFETRVSGRKSPT
ncbi:hypothetical protein MTO96_026405 [Rhipicephalus appendiculatus]